MRHLLLAVLLVVMTGCGPDTKPEAQPTTPGKTTTLKGHTANVLRVSFSPDGKRIASGSKDGTIRLWDVATGEELHAFQFKGQDAVSVSFSPDGKRIASGGQWGTIMLWDVATGEELHTLTGHKFAVLSVSFSPDGTRIVSGGKFGDSTIRLWDASTGEELRTLKGHRGGVNSVSFSPDGKRIVSGEGIRDNTIRLWDASTGEELRTLTGHKFAVLSVSFSPDGKRIASGSSDKTIRLWDASTGEELKTLTGHREGVRSVSFSPDGKRIASGSFDGTIRLWDASTGEELKTLKGHRGGVRSVSFSPDGKRIASGSFDHTIRLWNVPPYTKQEDQPAAPVDKVFVRRGLEEPAQHGGFFSFAVGPQAKVVAGGTGVVTLTTGGRKFSAGGEVLLWDAETGKLKRTLGQHQEGVTWLSFSRDGRTLASLSSKNRHFQIWELPSGKRLSSFEMPGSYDIDLTRSTVLSPDGKWLAVVSRELHKPNLANAPAENSIRMRFVPIPAGTFRMGHAERPAGTVDGDDDETPHQVTLKKPFELGIYEVTQAQYEKVTKTNPSRFKGKQNPVENVTWENATDFCRKLSELPEEKAAGYAYRLPTEAEWEYACRAGTTTTYSFGNEQSQLGDYGWYADNANGKTHPAGQKKTNAWGLYDMHGNVFEWCQDWYADYPTDATVDPTGPSEGSSRVLRGGSFGRKKSRIPSASRARAPSTYRNEYCGFRVVRTAVPSAEEKKSTASAKVASPQFIVPGLLGVWDTRSGKLKWSLPQSGVKCLAVSPDGESLAACVSQIRWERDKFDKPIGRFIKQSITAWNAANGQTRWEQVIPARISTTNMQLRFAAGRPRLLGLAWNNLVSWDLSSGDLIDQRVSSMSVGTGSDYTLRLSSDGRMAGIVDEKKVELWDMTDGQQLGGFALPEELRHAAFSPDLKLLVGDPASFGTLPELLHLNWTAMETQH